MREVPRGTVGRLAVRGPTGCRYLDDPRQAEFVRDGWNLTGDMFFQDEDGRFRFVARADDMIVSGGESIAAPGGRSGAAVASLGQPTAPWSASPTRRAAQIVKAFIVLAPNEAGIALRA